MIINIFLHFCVIRTENKGEDGQKSIVKIDKKKLTEEEKHQNEEFERYFS